MSQSTKHEASQYGLVCALCGGCVFGLWLWWRRAACGVWWWLGLCVAFGGGAATQAPAPSSPRPPWGDAPSEQSCPTDSHRDRAKSHPGPPVLAYPGPAIIPWRGPCHPAPVGRSGSQSLRLGRSTATVGDRIGPIDKPSHTSEGVRRLWRVAECGEAARPGSWARTKEQKGKQYASSLK
jgi:hypothetical protein